MMVSLPCDAPLELPLPRRVESSSAAKAVKAPLPAGFVNPEGVSPSLASHYDMMGMGSRGGGCSGPAKLFVGGVSAHTTTEALRGHFSKYGRIIDAVVMQKNGRPRGFGFVTFDNQYPADCVLAEAQWLDGRLVDVKRAVPGERAQERASNKIFVGGLPQDVSTEELRAYFSNYGPVADSVVMVDRRTNRSRGFGFVRFGNGAQGNAASEAVLMNFQNHRLAGKWVEVKRATPASQLQDMFPGGEGFDEELLGMTCDEIMAAASMGYPLHDCMGLMGWDVSPCSDSTATPMSMTGMEDNSVCSARSNNTRGRRPRRRQQRQKPGFLGDAEDDSDDGQSPTASCGFGEVAFVCNSTSGSPTASSVEVGFEARPLGSVLQDCSSGGLPSVHQRQRASSGGLKSGGGTPINSSENDPSRANATVARSDQPMKVLARHEGGFPREQEDFTRDDFLSLEVGRQWLAPNQSVW